MTRAVLSIGSNIGDSLAHLRSVVDALGDRLVAASGVYRTAPWGGVDQQPFLNAVLLADDDALDVWGWLAFAQACERAADRVREVRWGPRTLDVDVVAAYDATGAAIERGDERLTLPHPRAFERSFVLAPWVEVAPDAALPQGRITDLLRDLQAGEAADQQISRVEGLSLVERTP